MQGNRILEYMEVLDNFLEDRINYDAFTSKFWNLYFADKKKIEKLENNLNKLPSYQKSLDFVNLLKEIENQIDELGNQIEGYTDLSIGWHDDFYRYYKNYKDYCKTDSYKIRQKLKKQSDAMDRVVKKCANIMSQQLESDFKKSMQKIYFEMEAYLD